MRTFVFVCSWPTGWELSRRSNCFRLNAFVIMSPKVDRRRETLSSSLEINEHENKSGWNNNFPLSFLGSSTTGYEDVVIEQFGVISETFVFETPAFRLWGKLNWNNRADHYRAVVFLIQFIPTLTFYSTGQKKVFCSFWPFEFRLSVCGWLCLGPEEGHSLWTHSSGGTFPRARTQRFIWTVLDVAELLASQPRQQVWLP